MTQDHALIPPSTELDAKTRAEIAALALRWRRANGPMMSLMNRFGGRIEAQLNILPHGFRARVEHVTHAALEQAWHLSRHGEKLPVSGKRATMFAAIGTGALGGAGGVMTSVAELPVTITLLLHAIREEAKIAGFDPDDPWIMAESLRCFSAGSPLADDDGVNTAFISTRVALTGPAVQKLISTIAPRFAAALGRKLAAQAVPVLGALTGAALNAAFLRYYREIAKVRFGLLRLHETHGRPDIIEAFSQSVHGPAVLK